MQLVVKDSAGTLVKTQALDTRAGLHGFSWDGSTDDGRRRAGRRLRIDVVANVGGPERFSQDQCCRGACRASRSIRPTARSRSTPTLGEIAMSDVERVM